MSPKDDRPMSPMKPLIATDAASVIASGASSLEAHHLQKSYGSRRVVHDVSLSVKRGEVVGLSLIHI